MPYELLDKGTHLHIRFFGTLESKDFAKLFADLAQFEDPSRPVPHRLSTLSDITDFVLQFSTMLPIAKDRSKKQFSKPIRSAIVATRPIEKAIAGMLQNLNMNTDISIRIFADRAEAENWVNQPDVTVH